MVRFNLPDCGECQEAEPVRVENGELWLIVTGVVVLGHEHQMGTENQCTHVADEGEYKLIHLGTERAHNGLAQLEHDAMNLKDLHQMQQPEDGVHRIVDVTPPLDQIEDHIANVNKDAPNVEQTFESVPLEVLDLSVTSFVTLLVRAWPQPEAHFNSQNTLKIEIENTQTLDCKRLKTS